MNIKKLLRQAQEMQEKMQEKLKNLVVEGSSGGEMVKLWLSGDKELKKIEINPEVLKEEKEVLEDLILAAFNDASEKVNKEIEGIVQSFGGGLPF